MAWRFARLLGGAGRRFASAAAGTPEAEAARASRSWQPRQGEPEPPSVMTVRRVGKELSRMLVLYVQVVCMLHVIQEYGIEVTRCLGPSMLPTLNAEGDLVVVEKWTKRLKRLQLGDVVVAQSPSNPAHLVSKRILGMAGDIICTDPTVPNPSYITVPPGHVWLQGDNLSNSTDSRTYGPIPMNLVWGRIIYRIWPPSDIGPIVNGFLAPVPEQNEVKRPL